MDCCWLCGLNLKGKRRRYQDADSLLEMVREKVKPTPFVQAWLAGRDRGELEDREALCVPCVNWRRRVTNGSLKKNRRPYLQLDQLILYLLHPGRNQEPDARCMKRLVEAVRQAEGNCALHAFPSPVRSILDNMAGPTALDGLVAWWDYNGRTEFFRHPEAAKRVRVLLKSRGDI